MKFFALIAAVSASQNPNTTGDKFNMSFQKFWEKLSPCSWSSTLFSKSLVHRVKLSLRSCMIGAVS